MALSITHKNPIVVTGTSAASAAIESSGTWLISKLYWLNPATQGDKLALQDGDGKELFEFYAQTVNSSQEVSFRTPLEARNGIYCDDMDSGTLYIFIK